MEAPEEKHLKWRHQERVYRKTTRETSQQKHGDKAVDPQTHSLLGKVRITPPPDNEPKAKHYCVKPYWISREGYETNRVHIAEKHKRAKVHLHWRLTWLKQSCSLCNLGRGGTVLSAIWIIQEPDNRANGFLRELGRNELRSSYLYSRCKGLVRIVLLLGIKPVHSAHASKWRFFLVITWWKIY